MSDKLPMLGGLLACKIRESRLFLESYGCVRATLLWAPTMYVIKCMKYDKGEFAQVGVDECREKVLTKSQSAELKKLKIPFLRMRREFPVLEGTPLAGQCISPKEVVSVGAKISVSGKSIGHGMTGCMARHGFKGLPASHGQSKSHRSHGSTGCRTTPGRVFPGKKMAGRHGNHRVHIKGLEVIEYDVDRQILVVKGTVPGKQGWVEVCLAK